jgi:hypothetical protein
MAAKKDVMGSDPTIAFIPVLMSASRSLKIKLSTLMLGARHAEALSNRDAVAGPSTIAEMLLLGWNSRNSGIRLTAGGSLCSREKGGFDELLHDLFDLFLAEPLR